MGFKIRSRTLNSPHGITFPSFSVFKPWFFGRREMSSCSYRGGRKNSSRIYNPGFGNPKGIVAFSIRMTKTELHMSLEYCVFVSKDLGSLLHGETTRSLRWPAAPNQTMATSCSGLVPSRAPPTSHHVQLFYVSFPTECRTIH